MKGKKEEESVETLILKDTLHMCGFRHPPRKNRSPQKVGKEEKLKLSKFIFMEDGTEECQRYKEILSSYRYASDLWHPKYGELV